MDIFVNYVRAHYSIGGTYLCAYLFMLRNQHLCLTGGLCPSSACLWHFLSRGNFGPHAVEFAILT